MIDLHSHILPCIDDGPKTVEESVALVGMEKDNGVVTLALTPHFSCMHDDLDNFVRERMKQARALKAAMAAQGLDIEILLGAETALSPELLQIEDLSPLCYSGTDFMLTELPYSYYVDWIPDVLYELKLRGINPVIAHVERYPYIRRNSDILCDLVDSGVVAQANAGSFISGDRAARKLALSLLKRNLVHIIASDAHSVRHRPPEIRAAMRMIEKKCGGGTAALLKKNAESVTRNIAPETDVPVRMKRHFWSGL